MSEMMRQQPDSIDMVTLLRGIGRAMPRLLMASVAVGAVTWGVLSLMAPRYTSEVQLAISAKATNPFPDNKEKGGAPDAVTPRLDREAINTHVNALASPDLALQVAKELDLASKPEFNAAVGSVDTFDRLSRLVGMSGPRANETDTDRVLGTIKRQLRVSAEKDSRFIRIGFSATDPELAAAFANSLANAYRRRLVDVPVRETSDVVNALLPQIEKLRGDVIAADAEVERFRARTDQFRGGAQSTPINDQRMAALNDELTKAEGARAEAESRWRTANELSRSGSAEVLPEVQKSVVIQGLINQRVRLERQVSEASAVLLPAHPRMRQLNADLSGLRRSVDAEVRKVVQSLEKEFRSAALRVADIERQIGQLKTKVVNTSGDEAQLKSFEAAAKAKRAELERLQKQFEDNKTLVVTRSVPIEAQIVSAARASYLVTFPKKTQIALLAMAATLLIGLAVAFVREVWSHGQGGRPAPRSSAPTPRGGQRREMREAELPIAAEPVAAAAAAATTAAGLSAARMSMAAPRGATAARQSADRSAPVVQPVAAGPRDETIVAPITAPSPIVAPAGGAVMDVARHLMANARSDVGYRTMVSSETPGIDPVAEAVDLVGAIADAGKRVALIEWSPDGSTLARDLGISPSAGIGEVLRGEAGFEDIISIVPGTAVHFIATGSGVSSEAETLDADGLNLILDALDEAYDHIVVVGQLAPARALFEAIEGRFDAGVAVADARRRVSVLENPETSFLGFEVTEIDVIRLERSEGSVVAARRVDLSRGQGTSGHASL
ncbi:MAG: exopolysaccharide transport family protein [Hyphomicrobiaceae bacterium]